MNIKKWLQEVVYRKYYAYSISRILGSLNSAITKLSMSKEFIQKNRNAIDEKIVTLETKDEVLSEQYRKISKLLTKIEDILN